MVFYDHWFAIITDYFDNNLYLNTRGNPVPDHLNRHAILHGFNTAIYYSLENYLRLFHCLHFLSWAFGVTLPGISVIPTLDEITILDKWKAYEKIKLAADLTWPSKQAVYAGYPEYTEIQHRAIPPSDLVQKLPGLRYKNLQQQCKYLDRLFVRMRRRMAKPDVVGIYQPPYYDRPPLTIRLFLRVAKFIVTRQKK